MFRNLLSKFNTTPQEGGQETRPIINPQIIDPGMLKIAAKNIDLNGADTQSLAASGIVFENGILSINTTEDVILAQTPSEIAGVKVKGICVKSTGKIVVTGTNKLVLEHGLILDGNEVNLDALISPRTGLVKIVAKQPVELRNIIAASGVVVDAPEITNAAVVATNRLAMTGNKLTQKGQLITNTKDLPLDCIRDLSENNPVEKLFIDTFNQLDGQVKNCKANVRKPINERTASDVFKSGFVEVVKEIKRWTDPRSKIKVAEIIIEKDCEIGGAKLEIEAEKSLKIYGTIKVDNLSLNSNYIYGAFGSVVDGVSKLEFHGRRFLTFGYSTAAEINARVRYILPLFSGCIWASEKISINSVFTAIALGGRLWARDIFVSGGSYFNFLGWSAAHNFVTDTFIPIDLGLHTLYAITSLKELKDSINFPKFMGTLKAVANFIYKPFGVLLRAVLKVGTIVRSGLKLNEIYQKYKAKRAAREKAAKEQGEVVIVPTTNYAYVKSVVNDLYVQALELSNDPIDAINIMLALKNIAFAVDAIGDVQTVVERMENTPLNIPTDYTSARAEVEKNALGFALCWTPLFAPCKVEDAVYSVDAGVSVTGYKVQTNYDIFENKDYQTMLLAELPKLVNKPR